jgi:hypothetical protein
MLVADRYFVADEYSVARGFIPDGLRSSPEKGVCGVSGTPHWMALGLLRSPSGINPLTTEISFSLEP